MFHVIIGNKIITSHTDFDKLVEHVVKFIDKYDLTCKVISESSITHYRKCLRVEISKDKVIRHLSIVKDTDFLAPRCSVHDEIPARILSDIEK